MGGEWQDCTLGDLIDVKHGFAFQGEFIHDEPLGDILLTPGNFAIGGGFKGDKFKYYDGTVPDDFVLEEGDLLVTMTDLSKQSDTLGFPAVVPSRSDGRRYLHNQRLGKVQLKTRMRSTPDICTICCAPLTTGMKSSQVQRARLSSTRRRSGYGASTSCDRRYPNSEPSPTSSARWTTRSS